MYMSWFYICILWIDMQLIFSRRNRYWDIVYLTISLSSWPPAFMLCINNCVGKEASEKHYLTNT